MPMIWRQWWSLLQGVAGGKVQGVDGTAAGVDETSDLGLGSGKTRHHAGKEEATG